MLQARFIKRMSDPHPRARFPGWKILARKNAVNVWEVEKANAKQTVAVTLRRWPKKDKNCLHWTRLRRVTNVVLGVFNQLPFTASPLSHCGRDEGKKTLFLVLELNRGQKSYDDVTY